MYRDNDKASNNTNNRHICVKKKTLLETNYFIIGWSKIERLDISRNI